MNSDRLTGYRVAILASDFFEESELTEPRKALEEAGAIVHLIAPHGGELQASVHGRPTQRIAVDLTLREADPANFDALLLPGGSLSADAVRSEPLARDFARYMNQLHRPIAFICHGGWLLAAAQLVRGRHLTSYPAIQQDFARAGAYWYDKEVVREGNFVSSRQPSDIPAFNREMVDLFYEHHVHSRAAA
jgi:protease I